jgi:hypothetical protein
VGAPFTLINGCDMSAPPFDDAVLAALPAHHRRHRSSGATPLAPPHFDPALSI